jgi:hypothetical protein
MQQHMQNLKLLLGEAHASAIDPQFGGFEVELEQSEAN